MTQLYSCEWIVIFNWLNRCYLCNCLYDRYRWLNVPLSCCSILLFCIRKLWAESSAINNDRIKNMSHVSQGQCLLYFWISFLMFLKHDSSHYCSHTNCIYPENHNFSTSKSPCIVWNGTVQSWISSFDIRLSLKKGCKVFQSRRHEI